MPDDQPRRPPHHRLTGVLRTPAARTAAVLGVLVLAVVACVVYVQVRGPADDGPPDSLTQAMSMALPAGQRFSWTDWDAVRSAVHEDDLTIDSPVGDVKKLLSKGFDADLTPGSALLQSAPTMQEHYGFSPATISWELYSQSDQAAVLMVGLGDDADLGRITDLLRTNGYAEPDSPDGIWAGDPDSIKRLGGDLTPELTYVALDAADHVLLSSDTQNGAQAGIDALHNDTGVVGGLGPVVAAVGEPRSAELYTYAQVCSALAMSGADQTDQEVAADLLARAGKVNPLTGFAMGAEDDGDVSVAMSFDSAEQAVTNATTRSALASGPAPGQGGTFPERFTLGRVAATGSVVTMQLRPQPDSYVLSDLSTGPLLFATC